MSAAMPGWMRWLMSGLADGRHRDSQGSTGRVKVVMVDHERPDGTVEKRPTMKPRDRSRYTPRPRNGTPRRLHATDGSR